MRKAGVFTVLLALLAGINFSIWRTEQALASGQEVILELAPVDPRSLMQGDYMALNFALGEHIRPLLGDDKPATGHAVIRTNAQGVAQFARAHERVRLQQKPRFCHAPRHDVDPPHQLGNFGRRLEMSARRGSDRRDGSAQIARHITLRC